MKLYLDYNSTSPIDEGVKEAVAPFLLEEFGNPSSKTNPFGKRAKEAIETARTQLAAFLGAQNSEVIFTSGGTESCFHALVGAFRSRPSKKHFIISGVEHPAVLEAAKFLEGVCGADVTRLAVEADGGVDLNKLFDAIRVDTGLLSFMFANNETGVRFPIQEIVQMAHARGLLVHTDAVQAVGKIPFEFSNLGVDLLSLSGHKFGALKGAGALLVAEGVAWDPVVRGGGQEGGRRGGTEAVPLLVALGKAAEVRANLLKNGLENDLTKLRDSFEQALLAAVPGVTINGFGASRLPNTSSLQFPGVVAHEVVEALACREIYVSAGSACKAGSFEPSHVLKCMGLSTSQCLGTVRFSFGAVLQENELDRLLRSVKEVVAQLQSSLNTELAERSQ